VGRFGFWKYLTDSRHFHLSSFYLQSGVAGRGSGIVPQNERCGTYDFGWTRTTIRTMAGKAGLEEALRYVDIFPAERA